MTAFIDRKPCENCDDIARDSGTGAVYCKASPTLDFECERILTIGRISDRLVQVTSLIAKEHDPRLRASEAIHVADAYADILYELGATLDEGAVLTACCTTWSCVACEKRKLGEPVGTCAAAVACPNPVMA
ncbi:MAG TPA: hypothetical protein VFH61_04570 [Thermoleophilia bacterium]|nr:hypothetical protein [Thermoleophilia bacterium]